jgi:hypothetical protein
VADQERRIGNFGGNMAGLAAQHHKSLFFGKNGGSVPPYQSIVLQSVFCMVLFYNARVFLRNCKFTLSGDIMQFYIECILQCAYILKKNL